METGCWACGDHVEVKGWIASAVRTQSRCRRPPLVGPSSRQRAGPGGYKQACPVLLVAPAFGQVQGDVPSPGSRSRGAHQDAVTVSNRGAKVVPGKFSSIC